MGLLLELLCSNVHMKILPKTADRNSESLVTLFWCEVARRGMLSVEIFAGRSDAVLTISSQGARLCDGWNRREVLRVGALGALGLTLPDLLRMRSQAAAKSGQPSG